jgi:hypothetical protein
MNKTITIVSAVGAALAAFTATAFAAGAAAPEDGNILDLLSPVVDAFRSGKYLAAGAFAVVLAVALAKRYLPGKAGAWVNGDAGGALSALVVSFAGTVGVASGAGDAWSWAMVTTAGKIALMAAGGYALIKKLVIDPLRPLVARAPGWVQWLFSLATFVFDKATASPIKDAEKAGNDAVTANPPTGADGVVGKPEEL